MPLITLALLAAALGYAVFESGGVVRADWNVSLVLIGASALLYWSRLRRGDRSPALEPALRLPVVLLPAYLLFQLVPLPLTILRVVSPARAELTAAIANVALASDFAPLSVTPFTTFEHFFRYIAYVAVFLTIRELAWRFDKRTWLIMLPPVIMGAAEAAIGIAQAHEAGFARGTYVNRNHFAGFLELSLPFAFAYSVMILGRRRGRPLSLRHAFVACLAIATAALIFMGVVDSLSRMGFLASLAALMTVAMFSVPGRRRLLLALATAAVIAAAIWLPPDALIRRLINLNAPGEISAATRLNIWADTFRLIEAYPVFGCGAGAYESALHRYQTAAPLNTVDYGHSDYLQLLSELGIAGAVILAAGLFALVKKNIRDARNISDREARYLNIAALGAIVAILVHSAVDFNLYIPANALALAWIGGIAARAQASAASQDRLWTALRIPPVIETKAVGK